MMRLRIRYESSWTNAFRATDGSSGFRSERELKASARQLVAVTADPDDAGVPGSLLRFVQRLQDRNPELRYRVPTNFDNTVRGVLARLVGEVRRVNDLAVECPEHLALRAFRQGRYRLDVDHEYTATARLAKIPGTRAPGDGEGLVRDRPLYENATTGAWLFGHLELDVQRLVTVLADGELPGGEWVVGSPERLGRRLLELEREQREMVKGARRKARGMSGSPRSPLAAALRTLIRCLPEQADRQIADAVGGDGSRGTRLSLERALDIGVFDAWSLAGAVAVARVVGLDDDARRALVERNVLSRNGKLSGINATGRVGQVTPGDLLRAATGVERRSRDMPFRVSLPVDCGGGTAPRHIDCGVIVHSGRLHFELDGNAELEGELVDAIEHAAVGPLHFGKKGLAYLDALDRWPTREGRHV